MSLPSGKEQWYLRVELLWRAEAFMLLNVKATGNCGTCTRFSHEQRVLSLNGIFHIALISTSKITFNIKVFMSADGF